MLTDLRIVSDYLILLPEIRRVFDSWEHSCGKDRVIAITGAASGIGRALAAHLGQQGAALALSDIDEGGLSASAAELTQESGVEMSYALGGCSESSRGLRLVR